MLYALIAYTYCGENFVAMAIASLTCGALEALLSATDKDAVPSSFRNPIVQVLAKTPIGTATDGSVSGAAYFRLDLWDGAARTTFAILPARLSVAVDLFAVMQCTDFSISINPKDETKRMIIVSDFNLILPGKAIGAKLPSASVQSSRPAVGRRCVPVQPMGTGHNAMKRANFGQEARAPVCVNDTVAEPTVMDSAP